jgi:hypothetical protein
MTASGSLASTAFAITVTKVRAISGVAAASRLISPALNASPRRARSSHMRSANCVRQPET